uniref:Uncharacterized protein n=1 Tax=Knipowitschia caucasica TaxID=637954 RepID=A0AAV2J2H4_KNICA
MTETFIRVRAENDVLFTGAKFSASTAWRTVLEKLDLQEVVTPLQALAVPLLNVPGPSQAREQEPEQEEEEPEAEQQRGTGRKRKRGESELVKLYREDLRMQREEDERRAQERSANFDRLFCLLEKMIENKNK